MAEIIFGIDIQAWAELGNNLYNILNKPTVKEDHISRDGRRDR